MSSKPGGLAYATASVTEERATEGTILVPVPRLEADQLACLYADCEVRVAPFSPEEIRQLYAVRLKLDPFAAGLAARAATQQELDAVAALQPARAHGSPSEMLSENRRLHRLIYASCHHLVLIQILDSLWDRCDRYRLALLQSEGTAVNSAHEHTAIIEAFCRRDSPALTRLMTSHLEASLAQIDRVTFD